MKKSLKPDSTPSVVVILSAIISPIYFPEINLKI